MFSRRHPYLFFLLVFTGIIAGSSVVLSLISWAGDRFSGIRFNEKVGIVEIKGVIGDAKKILSQLRDFSKDDNIKALVVRIESPGGAVGPSQEIYREIQKIAKTRKVIASLGAVAASGGYYIASATHGIMANPGTITGSIGVILGYTNFEALFDKIGLYPVVIKSGEYKDMGSPLRKMTKKEKALLQDFSDNVHAQFIRDVALGRKMPEEVIRLVADGRIFSGETAQGLGLVDRLGNLADAVEWAGTLAGMTGNIESVYPPEDKVPFMEYLLAAAAPLLAEGIARLEFPMLFGGYVFRP